MQNTIRVLYSIRPDVVERFNQLYKGRARSHAIEALMERAIAEREDEVTSAARLIATDPDFAGLSEVSSDVDALSADTALTQLQ